MRLLQLFNIIQLSKNIFANAIKSIYKHSANYSHGGRDRNRTCDLILIRDAL